MRTLVVFLLGLLLPGAILMAMQQSKDNKPDMVVPTVTHHQEIQTERYDRVEITCPEGYEGHFVDPSPGFDGFSSWPGGGVGIWEPSDQRGYTVCFKKEFMDKIRSNPELLRSKPIAIVHPATIFVNTPAMATTDTLAGVKK